LGVVRSPCEPESEDHPQNYEKTAHATTDIHVIYDAVCKRLFQRWVTGSGGGEKGKRCGVKCATDRMFRLRRQLPRKWGSRPLPKFIAVPNAINGRPPRLTTGAGDFLLK
jgi:hypothetical protein